MRILQYVNIVLFCKPPTKSFISPGGSGDATRPLPRDGVWRNSMETQQSGYAPRSGPEVKYEKSSAKDGRRRGSDTGQSRRRRVRSCRGCPQALQEEFFSFYPTQIREGCDRGSEVGTIHSGRDGEGAVPPRKPKECISLPV